MTMITIGDIAITVITITITADIVITSSTIIMTGDIETTVEIPIVTIGGIAIKTLMITMIIGV